MRGLRDAIAAGRLGSFVRSFYDQRRDRCADREG
jgi:hypothetical protein